MTLQHKWLVQQKSIFHKSLIVGNNLVAKSKQKVSTFGETVDVFIQISTVKPF